MFMKHKLAALALSTAAMLGAASAQAATVASVELDQFSAGTLAKTIETAGDYTLDFSGYILTLPPLGMAAFSLIGDSTNPSVFSFENKDSIELGYLSAGTAFWAAIWALGGPLTASLTLVESPPPLAAVPVPASMPMLAGGLAVAGLALRRRQKPS